MSVTIRPVESKQTWETFMDGCSPNTFLQSWLWGDFHERTGHTIHRLGAYDGHDLVGCALIILVKARRGSFLFCPHGPIVRPGADVVIVIRALADRLLAMAKESGAAFIRVSPLLADGMEHTRLFRSLGFRPAPIHMHPELAWILDVTASEDDLLRDMRKTTRYSIRKAESDGVEIRMSSDPVDVETFWTVYRSTVDRQNFTPFSKEYLRKEFETMSADGRAAWFFGSYNGCVIAAAMIIFDRHAAYYHQGASTHEYPKITASYLLQWHAIKEAKRRGCAVYNFWGISSEDRPKHPWAGLSLFKKGFGGHAEPYLHAQDFVIHPRYWFTWVLETIRRIRRGL
ncbi:MAG TPA: peptidoglycan bridge formation glycyltransferase FemA/FemB family protein [Candidatus Methylomirabilis sp.]|nr:peptidoglycan bridge formation glycyltransferase FemA/FemB family protein [Candidatus Methylomirabilis sp.]